MESPQRMCVSCKKMKDKRSLIRIVKNNEEIRFDDTFKAAGRGAYVCGDAACIDRVCKYKLLNKAFKCDVPPEIYSELVKRANER